MAESCNPISSISMKKTEVSKKWIAKRSKGKLRKFGQIAVPIHNYHEQALYSDLASMVKLLDIVGRGRKLALEATTPG